MAHPALAKILAKVAIDVATDEKKRKQLLIIILIPSLNTVIVTAFIVYILTSPLSTIAEFFLPDELKEEEIMQIDYGYNQNLGIYEKDYSEGYGQSYEGIVFFR